MPKAGYRKATSKRALRELYTEQIDALAHGDPQRTRLITLLARLEGHDTRAKAVDYPDRAHTKTQPAADTERAEDEELTGELAERIEEAERNSRAWAAYFAREPLPEDTPEHLRARLTARQTTRVQPIGAKQ